MQDIFGQLGGIIIVAAGFALLVRLFKLPPLIGYLLAGVALGPIGLKYIHDGNLLQAFRQIGTALLLFLVGLELDWVKARHQFSTAAVLAAIQGIGSFSVGMLLALFTHQDILTGVILGLLLTSSSTVIIVKFLSESRDLNSLHGRLAVGITLIQDLLSIIALVVVSGLSGSDRFGVSLELLLLVVKSGLVIGILVLLAQYVLPPLFARIARSGELLFMGSMAWCFFLALILRGLQFPVEIGAFLAGISLAALPYTLDIVNRLRSLRDFFLVMFFVSLGSGLIMPTLPYAVFTLSLVAVIVLAKPAITFFSLVAGGYRSRTAFLTSVTQSNLGEFSLILVGLGTIQGQLTPVLGSSIVFASIISAIFSTALLKERNALYHLFRPVLHLAEHPHPHPTHAEVLESQLEDHIIIFGYHRMGYHILKKLRELHHRVVVVDFNPDIISKLREQKVDCVYGDIEDEGILESVHLERARMVVSTVPHRDETTFLIQQVKRMNAKVALIVTAHGVDDALHYYAEGADYVILPHLLGGEHVVELIQRYQEHSLGPYMRHRAEELKLLRTKNNALYYD